jgi:hypothetical protein
MKMTTRPANFHLDAGSDRTYVRIDGDRMDLFDGAQCGDCGADLGDPDEATLLHDNFEARGWHPFDKGLRCACGTIHRLEYVGQ